MGVSEIFLEPKVNFRFRLTQLNIHNYETGRQIIEENMVNALFSYFRKHIRVHRFSDLNNF